jgi:hypothetical protein
MIREMVLCAATWAGVTCALWTLIPSGVRRADELETRLGTAVVAGLAAAVAVGILTT